MILKRTSAPATEPVTLTEAKAHCRVDISDDDTLIGTLIQAAREYVEDVVRRSLITQTWRYSLDCWPKCNEIALPQPPLISVTSVVYYDSDGDSNTFATSEYDVDADSEPGRIVLKYGKIWPSEALRPAAPIQITYQAGYGAAASVPQKYKQAMLLLIGHWYENRETVIVGTISGPIALAVDSLIWLDRNF